MAKGRKMSLRLPGGLVKVFPRSDTSARPNLPAIRQENNAVQNALGEALPRERKKQSATLQGPNSTTE
eukprot:1118677-Alexandrium_andersonii.AAC.1